MIMHKSSFDTNEYKDCNVRRSKDIVNGCIRRYQLGLSDIVSKNNTYYIIPQLINRICLLYYHQYIITTTGTIHRHTQHTIHTPIPSNAILKHSASAPEPPITSYFFPFTDETQVSTVSSKYNKKCRDENKQIMYSMIRILISQTAVNAKNEWECKIRNAIRMRNWNAIINDTHELHSLDYQYQLFQEIEHECELFIPDSVKHCIYCITIAVMERAERSLLWIDPMVTIEMLSDFMQRLKSQRKEMIWARHASNDIIPNTKLLRLLHSCADLCIRILDRTVVVPSMHDLKEKLSPFVDAITNRLSSPFGMLLNEFNNDLHFWILEAVSALISDEQQEQWTIEVDALKKELLKVKQETLTATNKFGIGSWINILLTSQCLCQLLIDGYIRQIEHEFELFVPDSVKNCIIGVTYTTTAMTYREELSILWEDPKITIQMMSGFIERLPLKHKNKIWNRHAQGHYISNSKILHTLISFFALCIKMKDRTAVAPDVCNIQDKLLPFVDAIKNRVSSSYGMILNEFNNELHFWVLEPVSELNYL